MGSILQCPKCGEYNLHKSHSKNRYETIRKMLLNQRTYRCHSCNYRGWERRRRQGDKLTLKKVLLYFAVFIIASFVGLIIKTILL